MLAVSPACSWAGLARPDPMPASSTSMSADAPFRVSIMRLFVGDDFIPLILQGLRHVLQRNLQHLVYPFHRHNLDILLDVVGDLLQILDVVMGDHHGADA